MKTKRIKIIYWIATIVFALLILMDGIGGVTRAEAGQEVLRHLGYPMYALTIFGIAKLLAAVAILQDRFTTIKEWAYAGLAFNFIGAFASRAFAGDNGMLLVFPLIILGIMFLVYHAWKRYEHYKPANI